MSVVADYDRIGHDYTRVRRPDPRLEAAISSALNDAASVVNVGAGTGSYEPRNRDVVAVEPSSTMISQRAPDSGPAVKAVAEALPIRDNSFDAALAVLTMHHWKDVDRGLSEMLRVARERIVAVTIDVGVLSDLWLVRDYFPETLPAHAAVFPSIEWLLGVLPGSTSTPIPVPRGCTDGFMAAYWGRPEAYLDPAVRTGTSVWHRLPEQVVEAGLARLRDDLARGDWDDHYGYLRTREALDVGLRLICSELP